MNLQNELNDKIHILQNINQSSSVFSIQFKVDPKLQALNGHFVDNAIIPAYTILDIVEFLGFNNYLLCSNGFSPTKAQSIIENLVFKKENYPNKDYQINFEFSKSTYEAKDSLILNFQWCELDNATEHKVHSTKLEITAQGKVIYFNN